MSSEMSDYFMARLLRRDYASKLSDKGRRADLLVTSEGDALTMFLALNIDQRVAREGLDILE